MSILRPERSRNALDDAPLLSIKDGVMPLGEGVTAQAAMAATAGSYNELLGFGNHPQPPELWHHYLCNDASGNTLVDRSTNPQSETATSVNPGVSVQGPNSGYLSLAMQSNGTNYDAKTTPITDAQYPGVNHTAKSYVAWYRIPSGQSANTRGCGGFVTTQNRPGNCYAYSTTTGVSSTLVSIDRGYNIIGSSSYALDEWIHQAGVKEDVPTDPFGEASAFNYLNGVESGTVTTLGEVGTPGGTWQVGINMRGSVADVAFFEGKALTVSEVNEHRDGPEPYFSSTPPAPTGTLEVGQTLTADTSTAVDPNNGLVGYFYQWYRANDNTGTGAVEISGATAATYLLDVDDSGKHVGVQITPYNDGGTDPLEADTQSLWTDVITGGGGGNPPVNDVAPAITPTTTEVGTLYTCSSGSWSGDAPITYAYEWFRDGSTSVGTGNTYTAQQADVGFDIVCRVTATNAEDSVTADSNIVGPITEPIAAQNNFTFQAF